MGIFGVVVAVHGHPDLVALGHGRHPLGAGQRGGSRDELDAQRPGHLEPAVDLCVVEAVVEAQVVGQQPDAGGVELAADLPEFVERNGQAPLRRSSPRTLGSTCPWYSSHSPKPTSFMASMAAVEGTVPETVRLHADLDAVDRWN